MMFFKYFIYFKDHLKVPNNFQFPFQKFLYSFSIKLYLLQLIHYLIFQFVSKNFSLSFFTQYLNYFVFTLFPLIVSVFIIHNILLLITIYIQLYLENQINCHH